MSKEIDIREECCDIYNNLKDKTKIIDYLYIAKVQVAELQKQLEEKEKEIDEFKRIGEKGHFYDLFEDQRKENRILIKAPEQLLQQLKSQPAEIVKKIRKGIKDKIICFWKDEDRKDFNKILESILKEYQK